MKTFREALALRWKDPILNRTGTPGKGKKAGRQVRLGRRLFQGFCGRAVDESADRGRRGRLEVEVLHAHADDDVRILGVPGDPRDTPADRNGLGGIRQREAEGNLGVRRGGGPSKTGRDTTDFTGRASGSRISRPPALTHRVIPASVSGCVFSPSRIVQRTGREGAKRRRRR